MMNKIDEVPILWEEERDRAAIAEVNVAVS